MPNNEQEEGSGFFDRFFTNNPQTLHEEIHRKLNSTPPPTTNNVSNRSINKEMDDMLKAFGFPADFIAGDIEQTREMEVSHPFASSFQRSSYQIHQDNKQVQVDVHMPGVAVKDLKVEVLNTPTCVVQWSGGRGNKEQRQCDERSYHHHVAVLSHRVRLGNSVDCEKLSANLSRGILRMTAPIKKHQDEPPQTRSIPITERDD